MKLIAFIPARSGSKRVPGKNIRLFFGHPLIAYSIQGAIDSGLFDEIYVSSNSYEIGVISNHYGAAFIQRSEKASKDNSPDNEWIKEAIRFVKLIDYFAILRPTNPFRTGDTIKRAFSEWNKKTIMKAIEPISQHPAKMWRIHNGRMTPFVKGNKHLFPTQEIFPKNLHIQNASLEFRPVDRSHPYQPFLTKNYEGFDINTPEDLILAEALVERDIVKLQKIKREAYGYSI